MSHILTLVAPVGALTAAHLTQTRAALAALGADAGTPDWLAPEEAADIPFGGLAPEQAIAAARATLGEAPVDAIASLAEGRRKRLLLADMDSTIVTSETLDEIAGFAGLKEPIAEITRRSMNGELDFRQALIERVGMLAGLDVTALDRTWEATEITPGAQALVATMRAQGAHCAIVSGGFTYFTGRVADKLGFHGHYSNTLLVAEGKLTGKVAEPILDRDANLAMLQAAGLGVAWRAKPVVATAARARVDHADLRALLFAQGYRDAEIISA
jgi:phosphoserine phosphatase